MTYQLFTINGYEGRYKKVDIARLYNVDKSTMTDIINNKTWRNV